MGFAGYKDVAPTALGLDFLTDSFPRHRAKPAVKVVPRPVLNRSGPEASCPGKDQCHLDFLGPSESGAKDTRTPNASRVPEVCELREASGVRACLPPLSPGRDAEKQRSTPVSPRNAISKGRRALRRFSGQP